MPRRLEGNIPGRLMTHRRLPAEAFSFGGRISMLHSGMTAAPSACPGVNCLLFMHAAITLWSGSDGSFICIAASEINKDCHLIKIPCARRPVPVDLPAGFTFIISVKRDTRAFIRRRVAGNAFLYASRRPPCNPAVRCGRPCTGRPFLTERLIYITKADVCSWTIFTWRRILMDDLLCNRGRRATRPTVCYRLLPDSRVNKGKNSFDFIIRIPFPKSAMVKDSLRFM
ncbi:hypothetical protein E2C01_079945 [Portunus trituberculatus]|uniref:Uncharacterized protein n=1 Tax=Portunus trituberculatus TaxID=210409 RepID=A0A5B7IS43_PORTR|nr:hypothetical protein [Portunus trituberculatus]